MGYLDPVIRRRIAAVVLVLGAAVAALAIANARPFSDPPTDADRARAALESFFAAAKRHDYASACAAMTGSERSQIEIRAAALAGNRIGCSHVLESPLGTELGRMRVEIEDVRVSGNLAAIDAKLRAPGAKRPEYRTYRLEELGRRWRISAVSFSPTSDQPQLAEWATAIRPARGRPSPLGSNRVGPRRPARSGPSAIRRACRCARRRARSASPWRSSRPAEAAPA